MSLIEQPTPQSDQRGTVPAAARSVKIRQARLGDVYESAKEAGELDGLLEVVRGIVESGEATKH